MKIESKLFTIYGHPARLVLEESGDSPAMATARRGILDGWVDSLVGGEPVELAASLTREERPDIWTKLAPLATEPQEQTDV